jgi:hypothetical protein
MKTKHLLTSVAVIAALALSAPVWAQSGGNSVGLPGPNPGGPGLTPYSTGAPTGESTSVAPPHHCHARTHHAARAHHYVISTHALLHAHGPRSGTDTTPQLNQAELARVQSGAPAMAPASGPPPGYGGNSMGLPGPNMGGPGLTPYSTGTPQR